jgi:acetyl esterase
MPLHPQARQFLDLVEQMGLPALPELPPREGRLQAAGLIDVIGPGPDVAKVENFTITMRDGEKIAARRYEPEGAPATILWIHGGGFVICDLDSHDAMCRKLAVDSGCRVIAIDYRLAPEHAYPAAVEDSWDALQWVAEHYADQPLIVGGDSAGGNLAAVMTQRARERGGPPIAMQVLVYPAVDQTDAAQETQSYRLYGDGPETFLTEAEMTWFTNNYIADPETRREVDASPLLADSLAGLPPAIVVIAGHDPLRDQGLAYAERLKADGVPVTQHYYEGQIHAFFGFVNIFEDGDDAVAKVAADVRAAVGASSGAPA